LFIIIVLYNKIIDSYYQILTSIFGRHYNVIIESSYFK